MIILVALCSPIWIFTWEWDADKNGWSNIVEGVADMFNVNH